MNTKKQQNRFKDFLTASGESSDVLPLVHTTTAFSFADICNERSLNKKHCSHFDDEIVYLFYGRPAFRVEDSVDSELEFNWPIIFIFDPATIDDLRAVFPFDTGAFFGNLYRKFFSKKQKIEDFMLSGDLANARKIVGAFYGSSKKYYSESGSKNIDIGPMEFEAQGIQNLSRLPSRQKSLDERSSSIEVQVNTDVSIADSALAIILPQQYLNLDVVVEALEYWDIDIVEYYEVLTVLNMETQIYHIYEKVKDIYIKLGFLQ